mmetsp:Transcript_18410/g.46400  ORF Transcript_18410/g.46400 Transcript_18410/m.46400 type:complete len:107 (-) Transcript_18410:404-724(-)
MPKAPAPSADRPESISPVLSMRLSKPLVRYNNPMTPKTTPKAFNKVLPTSWAHDAVEAEDDELFPELFPLPSCDKGGDVAETEAELLVLLCFRHGSKARLVIGPLW